jgi:hypothetical protein
MGLLMWRLAAALAISALLAQPALAQRGSRATPMSDAQKAKIASDRAARLKTEQDYKAALQQVPDKPKTVDPWGNMRAPSSSTAK